VERHVCHWTVVSVSQNSKNPIVGLVQSGCHHNFIDINLWSWYTCSWKIAHLVLNKNHSLTHLLFCFYLIGICSETWFFLFLFVIFLLKSVHLLVEYIKYLYLIPASLTLVKHIIYKDVSICGEGPIVWRPISPTAHLSDNPLVRRPISPTTH